MSTNSRKSQNESSNGKKFLSVRVSTREKKEKKKKEQKSTAVNLKVVQRRQSLLPPREQTLLGKPLFSNVVEGAPMATASANHLRKMSLHGDMFSGLTVSMRAPYGAINDSVIGNASFLQPCLLMNVTTAPAIGAPGNLNMTTLSPMEGYGITLTSGTSTTVNYIQSMTSWDATALSDIALAFARYQVKALTFHYEPSTNASSGKNFCFAYSTDPVSPIVGIRGYFDSLNLTAPQPHNPPSLSTLDAGTMFVQFACWQAWSLRVPVDSAKKYMYAPTAYTGSLLYGAYDVATVRDTQFGVISVGSLNSTSPTGLQGRLWMDLDIEFSDPTPQNALRFFPVTRGKGIVSPSEEKKEAPESPLSPVPLVRQPRLQTADLNRTLVVDDFEEVVVPKYQPTRSTYPGSNGYTSKLPIEIKEIKK